MYQSHELSNRTGATRRTWLAVGGGLAAVLVLLILVMAACNARSDRNDALAGVTGTSATPTNSPGEPTDPPEDTDGAGAPATGVGNGGGNPGGGGEPGDGEPGDGDGEDTGDEPVEPVAPLSIEVSVDTVTPGGQCFAAGTIEVSGGEYPVTVHYQWRRLVIAGGFEGEPVSAVHNVELTEPGAVSVQTGGLPEDGTNVFLIVTGPMQAGSGLAPYDGCTDGPGDIAPGG